jgi:hypothetical protein
MAQDPNNYWEQLERLEKLIRASELKAGVIFSFHSLILGIFVDRLEYFQQLFQKNPVFTILLVFWLLSVFISIYYCFRCFMPRMEMKYPTNVFFFRDAVRSFGDIESYTKKLIEVCKDDEDLYAQLSQQIHVESKIIDKKFISVQRSIKFFGLSFIFAITIMLLWLILM